ncbi:ATP-binding cassette domain-containing protein [bacterium]|nr:ATP-binding cassette domain-containing protein [bacterium]
MLELDQVSLSRGEDPWIHPTTLVLERGALNILLGPTRAGKTSLMRLMAGLEVPTSGRLRMDGVDVTGRSVRKRNVAMVYQAFVNYPRQTVFENIASPLKVRGEGRAAIEEQVRRIAGLLRLDPYLYRKPLELSGGQQQRVALARALVKRAELVLLDEPLANLDYKLREEMREELPRLLTDSGSVVVYATSDPAEALLLGGPTAVLHEGRVAQFGPANDVYRRPQNLLAASAFSDPPPNVLHDLPLAPVCAVRAHHLRPDRTHPSDLAFEATVTASDISGSETFVHIDLPGCAGVMLRRGVHVYEPGATLEVFVSPHDVLCFDANGEALAPAEAVRG